MLKVVLYCGYWQDCAGQWHSTSCRTYMHVYVMDLTLKITFSYSNLYIAVQWRNTSSSTFPHLPCQIAAQMVQMLLRYILLSCSRTL